MEKDLRELFQTDEFPKKKLPENHETEFLQKLHEQAPQKESKSYFWRVAASIAIIFALGYFAATFSGEGTQTELQKQVAQIEQNYLQQIDQEWEEFVKTANDPDLVKYYKDRLDGLKKDYDTISKEFSKEPNNIIILEELIKNLQRRLELIKDIQEHLKRLNQNNKSYETIYL